MIEKLLKAGADANEQAPQGDTPLMLASRNGNAAAIAVLLDHHANIEARERIRGTTALMWAAEQGHAPAVKLLIARGADFSATSNADTKSGTAYLAPTPQQRALQDGIAKDGSLSKAGRARRAAPAPAANASKDIGAADEAAAAAAFGRGQNKDGGGLTALVFAAREGNLESAKILVEAEPASTSARIMAGPRCLLRCRTGITSLLLICSTKARIPTLPTTAGGRHSISRPITGTSKREITRSETRTWISLRLLRS